MQIPLVVPVHFWERQAYGICPSQPTGGSALDVVEVDAFPFGVSVWFGGKGHVDTSNQGVSKVKLSETRDSANESDEGKEESGGFGKRDERGKFREDNESDWSWG